MAAECSIGSLFSPCCTCSLSAHSRVISGGTLLPSAQCVRRGSKPALWLSNQICAVPGEYRQAERNRKARYQYFFVNRRQRGHGVMQGRKRTFPCSVQNEVRPPLNTASGMCSNVKFWIPQLCAAKPHRSKKASAPEEPCFYLQKGLTMKDILELWISAPFNTTVVIKQQSHPIG